MRRTTHVPAVPAHLTRGVAAAAALLATAGLVAGCSGDDGEEAQRAKPRTTVTTTTTVVPEDGSAQLEEVPKEDFLADGYYHFTFDTGDHGECIVATDGAAITCTGIPKPDLPRDDVPFDTMGAVNIGPDGVRATVFEGIPPTKKELRTGQSVDFGGASCSKPVDDRLDCGTSNGTLSVIGAEKNIEASSEVVSTTPDDGGSADADSWYVESEVFRVNGQEKFAFTIGESGPVCWALDDVSPPQFGCTFTDRPDTPVDPTSGEKAPKLIVDPSGHAYFAPDLVGSQPLFDYKSLRPGQTTSVVGLAVKVLEDGGFEIQSGGTSVIVPGDGPLPDLPVQTFEQAVNGEVPR
ncbi:hypothetical protein [Corynebacterium sp. 335C]